MTMFAKCLLVLCASVCAFGSSLEKPASSIQKETSSDFFPPLIRRSLGDATCLQSNTPFILRLIRSPDMLARVAETYLHIPFDVFAKYLMQPKLLPTWNSDYSNGGTDASLQTCKKFTATFTTRINVTVPSGFSFQPPLVLTVNNTEDVALFGWRFGVSDASGNDYYAGAHWIGGFREKVNGQEVVRYISWEKIISGAGNNFVLQHQAAFEYGMSLTVLQPDTVGAMCLERVYVTTKGLDPRDVAAMCQKKN